MPTICSSSISTLRFAGLALILSASGAAGCDGDAEAQDPSSHLGDTATEGKADASAAWYDFSVDGPDILTRTWSTTLHNGSGGHIVRMEFDDPTDNGSAGSLSFRLPCAVLDLRTEDEALLDGLEWLDVLLEQPDSLRCNDMTSFEIDLFPDSLRSSLEDTGSCSMAGDTEGSVVYFAADYNRDRLGEIGDRAYGCFRVEISSGTPQLWTRLWTGPVSEPSDWAVLSSSAHDSTCISCISSGAGGECEPVCEGESCKSCLEHDGGLGCIPVCFSDECTTCLTMGLNRECLGVCDNEYLPEACAPCVGGSGGTGCIPLCGL